MPKMKTKSSAKKRFKLSGTGKVVFFKAYRRHGMRKRATDALVQSRGGHIMPKCDAKGVIKYYLPNGL